MANTTLGNLLIVLRAETGAFAKGLGDAKTLAFTTSGDIVESLKRVGEQLNRLKFGDTREWKRSTELVGGLIAGIGVAAAGATLEVAKQVAEQGKQLNKLSQSYGLPIETVSQLRVAAKLTGVDIETLTIGFGRLAKAAEGVAESGQKTGGAFAKLKIDVTDADGKVRPMTQLIGDVADRFSHMENGTQKTALAMQLFGRSGAALIPFLNEGRTGIAEFTKLSDELGLTWTEKDVKAGEQLARTIEILELRGTAFKEQFAKAVIPYLDQLATAFAHVDSTGKSTATTLGEQMGTALTFLGRRLNDVVTGFQLMGLEWDNLNKIADAASNKPWWQRVTGVAAFTAAKDLDKGPENDKATAKYQAIMDRWYQVQDELNKPYVAPKTGGSGGNAPFVPGLGTVADMQSLEKELDALMNKAREALNIEAHDPLATEISNIERLKQEIASFRAAHPERIWADISDAVNKLNAAEDQLKSKQRSVITEALIQGGPSKTIESALGVPTSTPTVNGSVQQQAQLIKLQQDVNERNRLGAQIYDQIATGAEKYQNAIAQLNVLLKNGNITREQYDRALDLEKEKLTGSFDAVAKYRKELEQVRSLIAARAIEGPAAYAAEKVALDKLNQAQAEQILRTGTALQGMRVFFQQSQQQAVSWASRMHNALGQAFAGISSSISTAFSSMILGTKTVGQAFAEMGAGILTSIVDACTQMVAQWLVTHVIMAAISKLFGSNDAATKTASGVAQATMWANVAAAETLADVPFPANIAASAGVLALGLGYAAGAGAAGAVGVAGYSSAGGMERVPFDGARFILHKDETVLSAPYARGLSRVIDYASSGFKGSSQSGTSNQSLKAAKMPNHTFNIYGAQDDAGIVQKVRNAVRIEMKPYLKAMGARA